MKHVLCSAIFVALIVISATATIQSEQPSGSIKGHITVDGKAQPGVVVSLFARDDMYYDRRPLTSVITDAEGGYRFTAVAAGHYSVSTYSPVFVNTHIDHNGMNGRSVTVEPGEEVEDINFSLARGAVITGRVTDTEGRPVVSEGVILLKVEGGIIRQGFRTPDLQMMTTDDRGVYRIYGVLPGSYIIRVGHSIHMNRSTPGGRYSNYLQTFHPNATDQSKAAVVEVKPGSEATGVDIKVGLLKKTYVATGRMVDAETGKPVPNLFYGIRIGESSRPIARGGYRTDEKGDFRIELGEPNRVTIFPTSDAESNTAGQPFSFDLTSERVTGLEIKLRRAMTVSGVIVVEGANATPKFSELVLTARNLSPGGDYSNAMSAKIQDDGSFSIGGVVAGTLLIYLNPSNSNARRLWLMRVEHNGVPTGGRGIKIEEGENLSDLRVVTAYGNGVVRGQVRVEGLPLDSLKLHVAFRHMTTARLGGTAHVVPRGRFVIEGLPDGDYELMLLNDPTNRDQSTEFETKLQSTRQTVTVTNGGEFTITILLDLSEKK